MRYSATLSPLAIGIIFATITHAVSLASTTADGIRAPASFKPPARLNRNKTDFSSIFSEILSKHKGVSSKTPRQIEERDDTPPAPNFFELTFGPTNGANNAIGYMGFVSLPAYDVDACAALCNARDFDASSGPCIFFNIWTAVVNGTATTNVCSLYNTVTDASTATNTGQENIEVSSSRGYSRISLIQDGSFQDYTCILQPGTSCPFIPSAFWTRVIPGQNDFILVNNNPAHSGTSSALFFFTTDSPPPFLGSTLTYALPINTVPGKSYVISFFHTPTSVQPPIPTSFDGPMISALWNGVSAIDVAQPGPVDVSTVLTYFNILAPVVAKGNDTFELTDGTSFTHTVYVDDIAIFEKWY